MESTSSGQTQKDATPGIELTVNDQTLAASRVMLEIGALTEKSPIAFQLAVKNLGNTSRTFDVFKFGYNVDARWSRPNDKFGLVTRSTLAAGEQQSISIRLMPSAAYTIPPIISVLSLGKNVATIGLSYVIGTPAITLKTSGTFNSGLGLKKASYTLCLGKAPGYYHLDQTTIAIDSHGSGHQRECSKWMDCTQKQADNNAVCYDIAIQGHYEGGNFSHKDDIIEMVQVDASLHATYLLDTPVYRLTEVDEKSKPESPTTVGQVSPVANKTKSLKAVYVPQ